MKSLRFSRIPLILLIMALGIGLVAGSSSLNLNGRGLHAFAFNPIPANFTDAGTIAQLQETFLFWRVSKGGIGLPREAFPWASTMPPWEQHLTTDEIWKVIMFEYWHTGYFPRTWD